MALGSLGLKAVQHKLQKPTRECERCGLRTPLDQEKCVHCGELNDQELIAFQEKLQHERQGSRNLGVLFLAVAVVSGLIAVTFLAQ